MASVHGAAERDDVAELERLLDENPGLIESRQWHWPECRPLHLACEAGSLQAVRLLVERGADWTAECNRRKTPFMYACEYGWTEVVSYFLGLATDAKWCSKNLGPGLVAASFGCARGQVHFLAILRLLLEDERLKKAGPYYRLHARSALARACSKGFRARAQLLLFEGRADPADALEMLRGGKVPVLKEQASCQRLLERYEGYLDKAFLLSKARAVVDATESVTKAPEKVRAKTEAEAQKAREQAAPAYLKGRVRRGEALSVLLTAGPPKPVQRPRTKRAGVVVPTREEERWAVCECVVRGMKEDLFLELMEGLRLKRPL